MPHLGENIPNQRVFGREEIAGVCWCSSATKMKGNGSYGEVGEYKGLTTKGGLMEDF